MKNRPNTNETRVNGHTWKLLRGSNLTFMCIKCGVLGHSVDKLDSSTSIRPNRRAPYDGICELIQINEIMTV